MAVSGSIYIAGHTGLVGSAFARRLSGRDNVTLLTVTRQELDLTDSRAVSAWLRRARPDIVVMSAGLVGGIHANAAQPAAFIYENLMIEANVIHGAWQAGVGRVLNFGSACMYPKECPQPMRPEHLMTGRMEPTSEPYAIAKLAGLTMAETYNRQYGARVTTVIPCTLFGSGDNFDPESSHVVSGLIRKFHDARLRGAEEVALWGTGRPRREFLYVDDLVEACERVLSVQPINPINIGSGESVAIRELAEQVRDVVGFTGRIEWMPSRPDGPLEKRLDSAPMRAMGWTPATPLRDGLRRTYDWFLEHEARTEIPCASS